MDNLIQRKIKLTLFLVLLFSVTGFGQKKDTTNWCLSGTHLFVGSDSIEGKRIISGFYLTRLSETEFRINLSVLDNWVEKDSVNTIVKLVPQSLSRNNYSTKIDGKKVSVVKFKGKDNLRSCSQKTAEQFHVQIIAAISPRQKSYFPKEENTWLEPFR